MKLGRHLILAFFTLLCGSWLQADTDSHFFVSLNLDGSDCFNGIVPGTTNTCTESGQQGWGPVIDSALQGTITNQTPEPGFGNNVTCSNSDGFRCSDNQILLLPAVPDPSGSTRLGGHSTPITPTFIVPIDTFGGGATDFLDTLGNITAIELVGVFPKSAFDNGLTFTCDPGNAFDACGFSFVDPVDTVTVTLDFYNLNGDVHIVTPEPSTWILLGTAAFAIVGRRALRRP
jgi:hypothetical protein